MHTYSLTLFCDFFATISIDRSSSDVWLEPECERPLELMALSAEEDDVSTSDNDGTVLLPLGSVSSVDLRFFGGWVDGDGVRAAR